MELKQTSRVRHSKFTGLDHREGDTNAWSVPIVPRACNLLSRAAAQSLSGRPSIAFLVNLIRRIRTNMERCNAKRVPYVLKEKRLKKTAPYSLTPSVMINVLVAFTPSHLSSTVFLVRNAVEMERTKRRWNVRIMRTNVKSAQLHAQTSRPQRLLTSRRTS